METKNVKLVGGENIEMTVIDDRLSNFEKALQDVMHDAMGLVGDCISPLYIKEQAKYLLKSIKKDAMEGWVEAVGPTVDGDPSRRQAVSYACKNVPFCMLRDKVRIIVLKEDE